MSAKAKKTKAKEVEKIEEDLKKVGSKVKKGAVKVEKEIRKETKGAAKKHPRPVPPRPSGRVPEAMVVARHERGAVTRVGRGFSLGELSGAGLAPRLAAEWKVRIDSRRRSVLEGNVSSLKAWRAHPGIGAKVEGEAEKIVEQVEKAVHEVEKEAVAVEKKVRKGAKKAEEVVKEELEKPKARPKKKS